MSPEQARAVLEEYRENDSDGWLDIAARIEHDRDLTDREREAIYVLWDQFTEALANMATTLSR